jgi:propanol-preferring alcohol dehydrogenase
MECSKLKAMLLRQVWDLRTQPTPLELVELPIPEPGEGEVLLRISACGVCHTELDEIEGRTPPPRYPIIPGHQVVGRVEKAGRGSRRFEPGERVGVAWIYSACGKCQYCLAGEENLCAQFRATGRDAHGGYANYMTAPEIFTYPIPPIYSDPEAAPLLCAGAIGYRSLRLSKLQDGQNLGLTGFGASAHIVLKLAQYQYPRARLYVFSRSEPEQAFARELGAAWAGSIEDTPPVKLESIIDTTPVWRPVVEALRNLAPGGRLVINAIRKEELDRASLAEIDYPTHLWMEKEIKSVANITRQDVEAFLQVAAQIPLHPEFQEYPLEEANQALLEMKNRKIRGAKVIRIE